MNRHALDVLQFAAALDLVAGHASSPLGADAVRELHPSASAAAVNDELRRVDELCTFLCRAPDWTVPPLPDARAALRRLPLPGAVLDGHELRDIGLVMRGSAATRRAILEYRDDCALLAAVAAALVETPAAERALGAALDDAGDVRDSASRDLARLRRELRGARSRIVERLEQYMAGLPARFRVSDASVTVRDGRYVIPIRRDGRAEVGGLVHDESATGNTLFVEPPVAIELMNRLRELEIAEAREVQRILRELTEGIRPLAAALRAAFDALVAIDSLHARARYALAAGGHRPEVVPDSRTLVLVNARHPLLLATIDEVVPYDFVLAPGERIMLVSGPNTGGKTVLLKAVGLIAALAQAGVIPPVGPGTRLPLFDDIFADIGDEQSIEASLSTFSAHLKNLREILDRATPQSLALIDEMGSGTDPAEGGALADAILRALNERGTLTIATTHLGQLKAVAGDLDGVINASLEFDAVALQPTYRLRKGVPGRSYGLAIARRLGLPAELLARAEAALPHAEREAGQLLEALEGKDRALEAALAEASSVRAHNERLAAALHEREETLRRREREAERRARQQARDILLGARAEVEQAIRELRAAARTDAAALDEAARAARRRVEERAQQEMARTPGPAAAERAGAAIGAGSYVRVEASGLMGVVLEVRDDRATVEVGGLRMQLPVAGLVATAVPQPPKQRPARAAWHAPELEVAHEVDLRGMRVDEALPRVQTALDAAILADLPSLRIIHGKGTGALRDAVTGLLREDTRVKAFRPGGAGEGGTGVTVAELQ
jgi:DNA mismatch repair protein MutS2